MFRVKLIAWVPNNYMCKECLDEYKTSLKKEKEQKAKCDWCKNMCKGLRPHRDMEEGMYGRVYMVCSPCISRESDRINEELSHNDYYSEWD